MSALAAVFNRDNSPIDPHLPQRMLAARSQRGPHGTRVVVEAHVALAHQHLWLLPEEWGEEQPLESRSLLLSADVRLDNRQALGQLLGLSTVEERGTSDAGLLLMSYQRWGESCLDYILGDFAFALWDAQKKLLFCAVDALGASDLCYHVTDSLFAAASEISQLLVHPDIEARINDNRVAAFLANRWDNPQETFFEDIHYLAPAQAMIITEHEVRRWRHWDIDEGAEIRYRDESDYVEHYRSLLTETVRCRLRSTGPIAISLSGGLDSTSLAALAAPMMREQNQEELRSFSYAFDELASCDERRYIQPVVERYQIDAAYVPCDDRWPLKNLAEWPVSRDIVLSDAFAGLPAAVMEAAQRAGMKLLVAGYYGDTLAAGSQFWATDMIRDGRFGMMSSIIRRYSSRDLWQNHIVGSGLRQFVPYQFTRVYRSVRPRALLPLAPGIHPGLVARTDLRRRLAFNAGRVKFSAPGFGNRYQALVSSSFSQGIAATRHQYNQHGMEIVQPYYDRRLVEFVMAVPAYVLGRQGYSRLLQRQAMIGHLPEAVWRRAQRTTFQPLMRKGLRDKESDTVKSILNDSQIVKRQYVREDWLQEHLRMPYESTPEWAFIWNCISLELWLQRYWMD